MLSALPRTPTAVALAAVTTRDFRLKTNISERLLVSKETPALAPIKAAVLPLINKDGLPEKAREILDELKFSVNVQIDSKDAIGRRYRRQDAIGTPFCITVDHQTLEDNTVTIRHRDTMTQDRVSIDALVKIVDDKVSFKKALQSL